ncbi:macrosialin-like isoform X2 [Xiphophorus hellerii]|uniref:macrosialin-like isoform X2 n=1 Tax=Xiphophorus hellerii TaxID=8084 RepID=UPI0013B402E9|nr:macrosialin-like isoform X2 [Xiphophorus hellerii]
MDRNVEITRGNEGEEDQTEEEDRLGHRSWCFAADSAFSFVNETINVRLCNPAGVKNSEQSRPVTMQRVTALILVACCALIALSLANDTNGSKLPSTMSSAEAFDQSNQSTTLKPTTHSTTTPKPTTHSTTTPKPTTHSTTTPKPTTHSTTTPKPTTHSTTTPKPTTHKSTTPKPTTHKSTTPKPTTHKSTTPKPTTHKSTTPKPTTTTPPQPTPATKLTVGNYSLTTDKGVVCLMAQMALQIKLSTQTVNGTFIINPNQTIAAGECKETKANLTLSFKQGFITFLFNKNVSDNTAYLNAVSFSLLYSFPGNQKYSAENDSVHLFAAKIGHSYSCKDESVFMGNGLSLEVSNNRMQAFNVTKNGFGRPDLCPADQPDYSVAIAVGVTLLVLIVIVLIVYLLGRRKRTAGYQSL